jgi:hypothetical protein
MNHLTANDLKTRGVAAIEASLADGRTEAIVSVRGTDRYVVMDIAHYQHLRECELEAAVAETRADYAAGRYSIESPATHVSKVMAELAAEGANGAIEARKTSGTPKVKKQKSVAPRGKASSGR